MSTTAVVLFGYTVGDDCQTKLGHYISTAVDASPLITTGCNKRASLLRYSGNAATLCGDLIIKV